MFTNTAAGMRSFSISLLVLFGGIFLIWLLYNFQDWRNDKYQVTNDKILDSEKKPLGTEVKKTADLGNILSIEHEQKGLIGVLFNYGNVTINVGQVTFIFIGVFNPDRVHQDVFGKREELRLAKQKKEAEKETARMINWLLSYHDETTEVDRETVIRTVYAWMRQRGLLFPGLAQGVQIPWPTNLGPQPTGSQPLTGFPPAGNPASSSNPAQPVNPPSGSPPSSGATGSNVPFNIPKSGNPPMGGP